MKISKYQSHDYDLYFAGTNPLTKEDIKLYLFVRNEEVDQKIPTGYRYLYRQDDDYKLEDIVYFHKTELERPIPPKAIYKQQGTAFLLIPGTATFRDRK
jgi:hypothetical protein